MTIVRAACPHDCPDTCAMHVDGRGRASGGGDGRSRAPGHRAGSSAGRCPTTSTASTPTSASCTRWSGRREGRGRFRRASLGRGARPGRRAAAGARSTPTAARRCCPYSYTGTQGLVQGDVMAPRVMNALGATRARADDLRDRRDRRRDGDARGLARGRPGGVAARALPPGLGLEPDVDGAAPLAAAARGAPGRRAAGRRRPVPQPHRARRRRAPAAAARHRRVRWRSG